MPGAGRAPNARAAESGAASVRSVRRSLVEELLHNHRVMLRLLSVLLVVAFTTVGYLMLVSYPRLDRYLAMSLHARNAHIATLEQSTAMRGWLATGDDAYLHAFHAQDRDASASLTRLVDQVSGDDTAGLTEAVVATAVARRAWSDWADNAVDRDLGELVDGHGTVGDHDANIHAAVRQALAEGATLFDAYRTANDQSIELIIEQRESAVDDSRVALLLGLSAFVVALGGTAVSTVRRRGRVVSEVVGPTEDLLAVIGRLRDGDLEVRSRSTGVRELDEMSVALGALASSLHDAQREAEARECRLATLASRFETVVKVGREIAGSLSVRYVSASVTRAAADLLGAPTTLWVRGDDQAFHAASRSDDPHGAVPPHELTPTEVVAVAAADARPTSREGFRAYPLVLAGMVVGVLEAEVAPPDADTEQVLEALLSTAAASLESAHLHSAARELADVDALTHLPNRRRFEGDMEAEWERCRRYGRPMSLVMLDLDHFKTLNDEHGHLFGDEVLRGAAEAVASVLRASDTAYRYGGEEFAVLLRETGLEDAEEVAERLRRAVAARTVPEHGVLVTASAGVAERRSAMAHHTELVAKADAAMYAAKAAGRDRVVAAAEQ